ncbi:S8 family serine peptidase [Cellulomonas sp. NPDC055163]
MRPRIAALTAVCVGFGLAAGVLPAAAGPAALQAPAAPSEEVLDPTGGERPTDRGDVRALGDERGAEAELPAPQSVLVRFVDGAGEDQQRSALGALDVRATDDVAGTGFVEVPLGDEAPEDVVARLEADPLVAEVQLDHVRSAAAWTDDPLVEYTWPYLDLTRLPRAWDMSTGAGTVIAVLDTGVDATHPDLAGSIEPGTDLVNGDANPADDHGHGTVVAGAAMAHGNNGVGAVGAAHGARLLPVKVLDARGRGSDSVVAQGIAWAVDHGADVLNLSLGGPDLSPVLLAAMQAAVARGVVVVVAAGNDGSDVAQYPAAYAPQVPGVLAVGATDDDGALTDFSSWGDWVSIAAPGSEIVGPALGGGYNQASGTSLAAPFVSGTAALVLARTPRATPAVVEDRILSTARDAGPRGVDPFYGRGVLDAAAAVDAPARTVAPAVPLDRAPGEATPDDTRASARRVLGSSVVANLSPEGDVDWLRLEVPAAGWYRVQVDPLVDGRPSASAEADLSLEVRSAADGVLAEVDASGSGSEEHVRVPSPSAGPLYVRVAKASGAVTDETYRVSVTPDGPAQFTASRQPYVVDASAWVAVGDLTGDPATDALVVVEGMQSAHVYRGLGDGTLAPLTDVPLGQVRARRGVASADLDRDGDADAVVATTAGLQVLEQDGDALVLGAALAVPGGAHELTLVDLDADGDVDAATAVGADFGARVPTTYLNDGTGRLTRGGDLPACTAAVVDVTGDGLPDAVCRDGVLPRVAGAGFGTAIPLDATGYFPQVGDVTGDGRADVVRSDPWTDSLYVTPQLPDGGFGPSTAYPLARGLDTHALGDLDGDGRTDVLVGSGSQDHEVSALHQKADGRLGAPVTTAVGGWGFLTEGALELAHLDGDGHLDAVLASDALVALRQVRLDDPAPRGWVDAADPAPHTAGVGVRPTATVTTGRDLAGSSVSAQTVRLVDGATGADVPASVGYDPATRRVSLTPTADLARGTHYEVVVAGVTDTEGRVHPDVFRTWFTVAADGDRFTAVDPARVLDTRNGTGVGAGMLEEDEVVDLKLGGDAVPGEATAVVLNVTATQATGAGNVRVYPTRAGQAAPGVSNLNIVRGVDQPNLVTVALGDDGYVSLLASSTRTHLVADLAGYYTAGGGTAYVPVAPVRALDTRNGTGGVPSARIRAGRWVDLVVTGRNGVPADASAVVLNVTATNVQRETHVRVVPAPAASESQELPDVSNLNLYPGRDQANLVTVRVGDGGRVRLYTHGSDLDLLADLAGYYTPTGDHGYVPLAPQRIADTRSGFGLPAGPLATGVPAVLAVGGVAGVPVDAGAVVLNVTASDPRGRTHVRVFPTTVPATLPDISNLNLVPGRDEPNLAIVRLGTGGKVSVYSANDRTDLVVDVSGYFRR